MVNIQVAQQIEYRIGLKVEQYAFHNDDGGAGRRRGGKGVVLDYRVMADEVFLTYATSRSQSPPWGLAGGHPGSLNSVAIHRHDGAIEKHEMCTRLRVAKGELIRLTTASGGGYGDPRERAREQVLRDLKNGFITAAQARNDYGLTL